MTEAPAWREAEKYVASEMGLEHEPADFYDAVDPRTGEKYQVKSAQETVSAGEGETEPGRFRLWEEQHNSLTSSAAANGAAYYLFITSGRRAIKAECSEVTEWVNERGGWNRAGHDDKEGGQLKIPVSFVYGQV